jgi:hypothetical protein
MDIFRGRYRDSFEHPTAIAAKPTDLAAVGRDVQSWRPLAVAARQAELVV